jgi:hypothetical protein
MHLPIVTMPNAIRDAPRDGEKGSALLSWKIVRMLWIRSDKIRVG